MSKHSRQELIDLLLGDWLCTLLSYDDNGEMLRHMLLEGWEGLNNYKDAQLVMEAENAGLIDEEWDDE